MRVFNVRLAAILLGIAMVLGIGVYALNRIMVRSNASFFLQESENAEERAAEAAKKDRPALEEKSRDDAIKYLSWYVGLMPSKYKAMEHLGILLADKRNGAESSIGRRSGWRTARWKGRCGWIRNEPRLGNGW